MAGDDKTIFSFETVAALVAALNSKGGTLGMKDYELMASLDGSRTASSFDHQFRKVKTRAKELLEGKKGGNDGAAGTPTKNGRVGSKSATPASGRKRGRKARDDEEKDDEEIPVKKVKAEPVEYEEDEEGSAGDDAVESAFS